MKQEIALQSFIPSPSSLIPFLILSILSIPVNFSDVHLVRRDVMDAPLHLFLHRDGHHRRVTLCAAVGDPETGLRIVNLAVERAIGFGFDLHAED